MDKYNRKLNSGTAEKLSNRLTESLNYILKEKINSEFIQYVEDAKAVFYMSTMTAYIVDEARVMAIIFTNKEFIQNDLAKRASFYRFLFNVPVNDFSSTKYNQTEENEAFKQFLKDEVIDEFKIKVERILKVETYATKTVTMKEYGDSKLRFSFSINIDTENKNKIYENDANNEY